MNEQMNGLLDEKMSTATFGHANRLLMQKTLYGADKYDMIGYTISKCVLAYLMRTAR